MTAYLKEVEMSIKHTGEERRRLAENLRGGYDVTWNANGLFWLNGTLFGMDICARSEEKIRNGLRHLAAFIEPEPELTCQIVSDGPNNGHCSECGAEYTYYDSDGIADESSGEPYYYDGAFCKRCGAKVVEG